MELRNLFHLNPLWSLRAPAAVIAALLFGELSQAAKYPAVWVDSCGARLALLRVYDRAGRRLTSFRVGFSEFRNPRFRGMELRDPLRQVDPNHPFEVVLGDQGARQRLTFVEQSLRGRGVKKKALITQREVRIFSSDENPEQFTAADLGGKDVIVLEFAGRVDEDLNGTLHGVISEVYLDELERNNDKFRKSLELVQNEIVDKAMVLPQFQNRDRQDLLRQCKHIVLMRIVWNGKHIFFDLHPEVRPAYAMEWSNSADDALKNAQLVEFYSNHSFVKVDPDFARFVLLKPTPGLELPFFFPPPPHSTTDPAAGSQNGSAK